MTRKITATKQRQSLIGEVLDRAYNDKRREVMIAKKSDNNQPKIVLEQLIGKHAGVPH